MKKPRLKSIRLKFALIFIGVLLVSCATAFFVSASILNNYFKNYFHSYIEDILESANAVAEQGGLSPEETARILSNSHYTIDARTEEELKALSLSPEQLRLLHVGEPIALPMKGRAVSIAPIPSKPGSYFVFTLPVIGTIMENVRSLSMFGLFLCACIGTVLLSLAVSFVTKPIKRLTDGTKKVAEGDFTVRVKNDSADEIGTLVNNFNLMTEQLGNIEYLRKDFVSNVSHEFKNPIASILGFAKLMKRPDTDRQQLMSYLDIIEEEAGRLSHLSANLLNLSRIENRTLSKKVVTFPLDEQIRKIILLFADKWEAKNIAFDLQLDKTLYRGDDELIAQIWINLLDNAIKFTGTGGNISVLLRSSPEQAVVTVADDGVGIPRDKLQRIFEKFYQADDSHATKGSGLGLSIVKSILTLTGGSVAVTSEEGEGTVFVVKLPMIPANLPPSGK